MPVEVTVESPKLAQFQSALDLYMKLSSKTPDEVIRKKAKDLGVRLHQGFDLHKFGGPGARKKGIAEAEFRARSERGSGTIMRPALRERYKAERAKFNRSTRKIGQLLRKARTGGTLGQWAELQDERKHMRKLRSRLWNRFMRLEIGRRQQGVGVLGASFLWFKRFNSKSGSILIPNSSSGVLGEVIVKDLEIMINSFAQGARKVSDRHAILDAAMQGAVDDMTEYFKKKQRSAMELAFGNAIGGAA